MTKFVILNAPRVGSNLLCTMLDAHPEILCHHEIFNPHVLGYARSLNKTNFSLGSIAERAAHPVAIYNRIWEQHLDFASVGFKLCWRQHKSIYYHVLEDTTVRKIILKRKNQLQSFVSLLLARKTGDWVVYNDEKLQTQPTTVQVDVKEYQDFLQFNDEYHQEINQFLTSTNQPVLELFYEDLFKRPTLEKLVAYLQVSSHHLSKLHPGTQKINPTSLSQLVENFDAIAKYIVH